MVSQLTYNPCLNHAINPPNKERSKIEMNFIKFRFYLEIKHKLTTVLEFFPGIVVSLSQGVQDIWCEVGRCDVSHVLRDWLAKDIDNPGKQKKVNISVVLKRDK